MFKTFKVKQNEMSQTEILESKIESLKKINTNIHRGLERQRHELLVYLNEIQKLNKACAKKNKQIEYLKKKLQESQKVLDN